MITEYEFDEIFDDNVHELIHATFEDDMFYTEDAEDDITHIIERAKEDFFHTYMPPRQYSSSIITCKPDTLSVATKLEYLRGKYQPEQRSNDWYSYRYNLITASNAFKAFENQVVKNQLIYEKCQPLTTVNEADADTKIVQLTNTKSPLHWGQKYEPLSVLIYERMYNTTIEDYGCIKHDKHHFIGASPDGINNDPSSDRYGRLLEIKNIVNREITGIPKKEYWVQMQLQMEVCDIDECDFLETKFVEYADESAFNNDRQPCNLYRSSDNKHKGVIMYFHVHSTGKPLYIYSPVTLSSKTDCDNWQTSMLQKYVNEEGLVFVEYIYWKLEILSCVLVPRNRIWFNNNVWELEDIWASIEHERLNGHEHRAPQRREPKTINNCEVIVIHNGCLI